MIYDFAQSEILHALEQVGIDLSVSGVRSATLSCAPLTIESGRLFAPQWDEAFVDLQAVLVESVYDRLIKTSIIVVELSRPDAMVTRIHDRPVILLTSALIDLIAFWARHEAACGAASFQSALILEEMDMSVLPILANFVEHRWPLLDEIATENLDAYRTMVINRDCMILFVLLHELGHIECGHLDGHKVVPRDFSSFIPDLDTPAQAREIEADRYACDAITNQHVLLLASSFFSAWTWVQVSRKVQRGKETHLSRTHPLAINRLHLIDSHLKSHATQGTVQDRLSLEAQLRRRGDLLRRPADFGVVALEFSWENGRARHNFLLAQYEALTTRFL